MRLKNETNNKYGFLISARAKVVVVTVMRNIWVGTQISDVRKMFFGQVSSEISVRH